MEGGEEVRWRIGVFAEVQIAAVFFAPAWECDAT